MNQLMLLVVALVVFVWFGGTMVPAVLRQNKMLLLGAAGGLVLCSFFGMQLEGLVVSPECCQKRDMDESLDAKDRVKEVISSGDCVSCHGGGIDCNQYEGDESRFLERCRDIEPVVVTSETQAQLASMIRPSSSPPPGALAPVVTSETQAQLASMIRPSSSHPLGALAPLR